MLRTFIVALSLISCFNAPATAATFLFTSDELSPNVSTFIRGRAQFLGNTVTSNSLSNILGMSEASLSGFDVVWISPNMPTASYDDLRTAVAIDGALEKYVRGGGTLVLNVAKEDGLSENNIAPGGVDFVYSTHNSETINTGHPYYTGTGYPGGQTLHVESFNSWDFSDYGYLQNLPIGATTILSNAQGVSMSQYQHGQGTVIVSTLSFGWKDGSSDILILDNPSTPDQLGSKNFPLNNLIYYSQSILPFPAPPSGPSVVPEPTTLLTLLGSVLGGTVMAKRRGRK